MPGARAWPSTGSAPRPHDGRCFGAGRRGRGPVPAHLPSLAEKAGEAASERSSSAGSSSGARLRALARLPALHGERRFSLPRWAISSSPTGEAHPLFPSEMDLPLGVPRGSALGLPSRVPALMTRLPGPAAALCFKAVSLHMCVYLKDGSCVTVLGQPYMSSDPKLDGLK